MPATRRSRFFASLFRVVGKSVPRLVVLGIRRLYGHQYCISVFCAQHYTTFYGIPYFSCVHYSYRRRITTHLQQCCGAKIIEGARTESTNDFSSVDNCAAHGPAFVAVR